MKSRQGHKRQVCEGKKHVFQTRSEGRGVHTNPATHLHIYYILCKYFHLTSMSTGINNKSENAGFKGIWMIAIVITVRITTRRRSVPDVINLYFEITLKNPGRVFFFLRSCEVGFFSSLDELEKQCFAKFKRKNTFPHLSHPTWHEAHMEMLPFGGENPQRSWLTRWKHESFALVFG